MTTTHASPSEPTPRPVLTRRSIRRPAVVVGLFLSLFVALGAWAISSPTGSSPDDAFHLTSIWCARDLPGKECDLTSAESGSPGTLKVLAPERIVRGSCYAMNPVLSASCQAKIRNRLVPGPANDGLYPAGFYGVMHLFVSDNLTSSVIAMRIANSVGGSLLILAALLIAPAGLRRAFALSLIAMLVPLGMFFIPSTNPTSWAIIGTATYWVFLIRFLTGHGPGPDWLAAVLAAIAALLPLSARADGAAFICVVTVAVVLLSLRRVRDLRSRKILFPLVLGTIALVRFLTMQSASVVLSGASTQDASQPGRSGLSLLIDNLFNFPTYLVGLFGQTFALGWIDTVLPPVVGAITGSLAVGILLLSVGSYWSYKRLGVVLLAGAVVAVPMLVLQQSHAFVGETVQPRYIYPLFIVLIGCIAYTPPWTRGPEWRLLPGHVVLLAVGATLANAYALHTEIRRYTTGLDVTRVNLAAPEWWWHVGPGPVAVWVIGSIGAGALFSLLGVVALGREGGGPTSGGSRPGPNRGLNDAGETAVDSEGPVADREA